MNNIQITTEEKVLLKNYFQTSPIQLIRLKAQAVIMQNAELSLDQISGFLFRSGRVINRWLKDFYERRMASLFSGHIDNENAAKLTKKQKLEIKNALKMPPSEYGLPKKFWDVPQLKNYINERFGVVFESEQSYHYLLKFCDLSFKYPDTFSIKRDENAIEKRIKEIREEIVDYMKNSEWEVLVADETRMQLEAITRRAWLKKGERTVLKVDTKSDSQCFFGALNQKNFKCHVYPMPWQNQDEIIVVLQNLLAEYPDKKICLIWDNAAFHKGKKLREELKIGGLLERLHLINFPPYAPDYNPIEHVWNTVKSAMANVQIDSIEQVTQLFFEEIDKQTFAYQI
jgi:hypothetical protein